MDDRIETASDTAVIVRWMIRRHLPQVLEIEQSSFEFPWSEDEYRSHLTQRNCIGMVAEIGDEVVGAMVYELHKTRLRVTNFVVSPSHRRRGIGTEMVAKLVQKMSQQRREEIVLDVRETNLAAQLFFRSQGFQCIDVIQGMYEETSEDAYRMSLLAKDEQ